VLFLAHEFQAQRHMKPDNFLELFEFTRHAKVKNVIREEAMAAAKAGAVG
jgi:hypothetical protein